MPLLVVSFDFSVCMFFLAHPPICGHEQIFLYGGYFKEAIPDKIGSEKGIVHSDMWSLDPRTWEWNKVIFFGSFNFFIIVI